MEINPELVKEWHPPKNESITPNDVTPGSSEQVWWKCFKEGDHGWKTDVYSSYNG